LGEVGSGIVGGGVFVEVESYERRGLGHEHVETEVNATHFYYVPEVNASSEINNNFDTHTNNDRRKDAEWSVDWQVIAEILRRAKRGAFLMEQGGGERAERIELSGLVL